MVELHVGNSLALVEPTCTGLLKCMGLACICMQTGSINTLFVSPILTCCLHAYTVITRVCFSLRVNAVSRQQCCNNFPHPSPLRTIVYEMVTTKRPFPATPGELIIWNVGNGRCQSLHHMNAGKLRDVVQSCWSHDPELRPSFKELLCTFEHNVSTRHQFLYQTSFLSHIHMHARKSLFL